MSETKEIRPSGKTLSEAGAVAHVANIVHHGQQLILPEAMEIPDAIDLLQRRQKYLQEEVNISRTFDVFPWDGAYAINQVLTEKYGWSPQTSTPGFFGPKPPALVEIEIDFGKTATVPWGSFSLPSITGRLQTATQVKEGRIVFQLTATVLRKDEAEVRDIFDRVSKYLSTNSIYRGKAIKLRFLNDDGSVLSMPQPKFLDTSKINPNMAIYPASVQESIITNLFTPITRVKDCLANGIPVKRGVLLGGTFGTGKTLAAHIASKLAVDSGITYIYCPRADELSYAIDFGRQYQSPACVIFCEDIDRAIAGDERTVEMDDLLNIIDGIDTKGANIIVVLTTNDLNSINAAMLRPGRLDAVIEVTAPDAKAVERIVRLYAGSTISPETDLTAVGKELAGHIPAVISEVVKRAKLAQLALQEPGTMVTELTEKALLASAKTMGAQLKLLNDRSNPKGENLPTLDAALTEAVRGALNGSVEKIEAIYTASKKIPAIHSAVT